MPLDEPLHALVKGWVLKAEQDMQAAVGLLTLEPPILYPACFHAQQASETYLKALLTAQQLPFPKSHSIALLLDLLENANGPVGEQLQEAVALTPFGVQVRYPGDMPEPGEAEAKNAVRIAETVQDAVVLALKHRYHIL